jgi:hypothetical protein
MFESCRVDAKLFFPSLHAICAYLAEDVGKEGSFALSYPLSRQTVDQQQLGTYTASNNILPFSTKLVTLYYFWCGPKTSLLVAPQVADSTHPTFREFRCPKPHVCGQVRQ